MQRIVTTDHTDDAHDAHFLLPRSGHTVISLFYMKATSSPKSEFGGKGNGIVCREGHGYGS
jgi:hypothetical protein